MWEDTDIFLSFSKMSVHGVQRIKSSKQTLDDAYNPPSKSIVCKIDKRFEEILDFSKFFGD